MSAPRTIAAPPTAPDDVVIELVKVLARAAAEAEYRRLQTAEAKGRDEGRDLRKV